MRFSAASVGLVNGGKAYENGQMAGGRLVISAHPRIAAANGSFAEG